MKTVSAVTIVFFLVSLAGGCSAGGRSPTIDVFGSYFPSWMACLVLGVVLTVIARQVLCGFKLDAHVRAAGLVYPCMIVLWTMIVWSVCFKN
jgi:hypothetical protein